MTTIRQVTVTCALCAEQTLVSLLNSTSTFGPPDLDLRPAEPARSSLFAWVQRCSSCGYCAPSIDKGMSDGHEIVKSAPYRALLGEADLPELARSFLCSSMIFEQFEEEAFAARNAIRAAWVCDDEELHEAATRCRLRAVELLREPESEGDALFRDPSTENAVIVDLLRRSGRFEDAAVQAHEALAEAEGTVAAVLAFSRSRALAHDAGVYTVEDAMRVGANDEEIVEALRTLVAYAERGDYYAKSVILTADDRRNYYVQFACAEGGLFCEVVHNKYLEPEHAFTGDEIAKLLALGFDAPDHEDQNLYRVFRPESEDDYAAIVLIVRAVVTDFFGLLAGHPLELQTHW